MLQTLARATLSITQPFNIENPKSYQASRVVVFRASS